MTKKEYIEKHPKSYLAGGLRNCDWPDDTVIEVVGGLWSPWSKGSNLYCAIERSNRKQFVQGGHRQHGTEGWWWAVA